MFEAGSAFSKPNDLPLISLVSSGTFNAPAGHLLD